MMTVDEVRALLDAATPGPWVWHGSSGRRNKNATSISLATWHSGIGIGVVNVMSAMRAGMNRAVPCFYGIDADRGWPKHRTSAADLAVHEVDYRDDIVGIDHPDARLIAAAPDLAAMVVALAGRVAELEVDLKAAGR